VGRAFGGAADYPKKELGISKPALAEGNQVQAVDSSNAEIAGVVQSKQVEDIPLDGRKWSTLAMLAPGVVNFAAAARGTCDSSGGARTTPTTPLMVSMLPTSRSRTRTWVCACPFRWLDRGKSFIPNWE
jgi:hypothetical protein